MTREEAIEVYNGLINTKIKEAFEFFAPELRESEDERIREQIEQALIEHDWSATYKVSKDDCLAWLEKQKENPKNADSIPADCVSDAKCEDRSPKHTDSFGTDIRDTPAYWRGWDDAMKQKEQKHPNGCFTCDEYKKGYEAGRFHGFTAGYNKAMKEQKPEECIEDSVKFEEGFKTGRESGLLDGQKYVLNNLDSYGLCKPAEWNEEDDEMVEEIKHIVFGAGSVKNGMRGKIHDWLYNRLKYLCPVKQEWSEEDTEMYINVASSLRGYACGLENEEHKRHIQKGLDWLKNRFKSLRPQPKQEWSEEDENALKYLHELIGFGYSEKFMDAQTTADMREWVNKSLRPSWKPSEEQMDALLWCTAHLGGADRRVLAELYEHLKKLM